MKSRLAVFCGSKSGNDPLFEHQAEELGRLMARNGIGLVYGGGGFGLMGMVADAVMKAGGNVVGVIPSLLAKAENAHQGISDLHIVDDMHARKKMMYELCGAAFILPGGNGTMDEFFEMITWNSLKIHSKKIYLLNIGGYYDKLIDFMIGMEKSGFLHGNWAGRLEIHEDVGTAIDHFLNGK